jgi:ABC-type molybdate transport system substrate-binding protein
LPKNNLLIGCLVLVCAVVIGIAVFAGAGAISSGSAPVTLTVMMPYDQNINSTMTQIAHDYGKTHNVRIDLISVKGRQSIINGITSGNVSPDLVVIEDKYALFNLSGLGTLERSGIVGKSAFLCRSNAVLVVPNGSQIHNVTDLSGKKVAVVDMDKYHSPGGCLANYIVADINASFTPVNESNIPQVYGAVANSSADATCIWKSEFDEQQKKTSNNLTTIVIPQYGMDNYLVLINNSKNSQEASKFMDYILSQNNEFTG